MFDTPVIAMSIELEMIASVITPPEVMIDHRILMSFRPSAAACFSMSFFSSMMIGLDVDEARLARDVEVVALPARRLARCARRWPQAGAQARGKS